MLQRLMGLAGSTNKMTSLMLDEQHRMHPEISQWPNKRFYAGQLQDAPVVHSRVNVLGNVPPYTCVNVRGFENRVPGGSICNKEEAALVVRLVLYLMKSRGFPQGEIAIITFYSAQVRVIHAELRNAGVCDVKVATVDGFQGGESPIVILSFVRGINSSGIGFLNDFRRLNVALTRAQSHLFMFGCVEALCRDPKSDVSALFEDARHRDVTIDDTGFRSIISNQHNQPSN